MHFSRLARIVVTASVLVLLPVGSVASAQTPAAVPCAIVLGPLTTQQESAVNDYEVLVAKANSKHTVVPMMPDEVFVLIGCISPASQTSAAAASVGTTTTSTAPPSGSQPAVSPTPAPSATPTTGSTSTPTSTFTFTCPPNGLSKDQLSMINDFEILVARANSKHTAQPTISPEVAAFIACQ